MSLLSVQHVDGLNTGFIILSAIAAVFFPFELFIGSYIILGPLHYLTELNWLKDRRFFIASDKRFLLLVALSVLVTFIYLASKVSVSWASHLSLSALILGGLLGSIALLAIRQMVYSIIGFFVLLFIGYFLTTMWKPIWLLALFVPTVIHVYFFTLAFMWYGSLKVRSVLGYFNIILLIAAGVILLYFSPSQVSPSGTLGQFMSISRFNSLSSTLLALSGHWRGVQSFLAFAYTYHYLNWFSKTSIIRWHEIPTGKWITVIVLWLSSVGLFLWDIRAGVFALFGLSILHVVMEFPLNIRSIQYIAHRLMRLNQH
ncbi:MAG: hypothetical protein KDC12_13255 [Flavobacteriales bacterium]|nr:hypothetical protein [Flavobacteriales bacterium]